MLFEVQRTTVRGRPVLGVRGELDIATAPELGAAVDGELAQSPSSLLIDLTDTTFLDSTGARELAQAARRAARAGTALRVVCPATNTMARRVIDILELHTVVQIIESAAAVEDETAS